jgi:WD40 repeat protein
LKNNVQSGFGSEFVGISTAIAFSRNGVLAAPSSISSVRKLPQHDLIKVLLNQNQPIRLWDSKTGKLILSLTGQPVVRALAFSPDGSHLATGGIDHLLKLWDVSTGGLVHTFKGHKGAINSVDFSPDGRMLATGSSDTTIKIWRIQ